HRVEPGGLARTGGTEETDDGVLAGQGAALRGGVRHPRQVGVLGGGEEALAQVGGLPQGLQAFGEAQFLPEHQASPVWVRTSCSAVAAASRSSPAEVPAVSSSVMSQ